MALQLAQHLQLLVRLQLLLEQHQQLSEEQVWEPALILMLQPLHRLIYLLQVPQQQLQGALVGEHRLLMALLQRQRIPQERLVWPLVVLLVHR